KVLARLWSEVLKVEQVGIEDNFFELGGDSILSLQITARARAGGVGLTARDSFQYQTIAELAAAVESKISTQDQSKDKAEARTGAGAGVGLTPIQEWFFEQHQIEPNYYNMPVMLEPRRKIETGVLQQSLNRVTS